MRPFSLLKPLFEAKLLITLITMLDAKRTKRSFVDFVAVHLPMEKQIRPVHKVTFLSAELKMRNAGMRTAMPWKRREAKFSSYRLTDAESCLSLNVVV